MEFKVGDKFYYAYDGWISIEDERRSRYLIGKITRIKKPIGNRRFYFSIIRTNLTHFTSHLVSFDEHSNFHKHSILLSTRIDELLYT